MSKRPYRFVALLLVLCVALGPAAGALAASHACGAGGDGAPVMTGHAAHMQLQSQAGMPGGVADTVPAETCQDCPSGCCGAALCSANACATGAATVTSSALPILGWQGDDGMWPAGRQLPRREQPTSLFRPPRS